MRGEGSWPVSSAHDELPRLLTAAETAAPVDAVDVVAEDLRQRFEATKVSFLIVDANGRTALVGLARIHCHGPVLLVCLEGPAVRAIFKCAVHQEVFR